MIKVIVHEERDGPSPKAGRRHGKWRWAVWKELPNNVVQWRGGGFSRQPLLDACRELKRTGEPLASTVGLFREGRSTPDLLCTVGAGAGLNVREDVTRFEKWKSRQLGTWSKPEGSIT